MNKRLQDELRADGRYVVDHPGRKAMVYANPYGQVIVMFEEDGERCHSGFEPEEIPALIAALTRASREAQQQADQLEANYQAWMASEDEADA